VGRLAISRVHVHAIPDALNSNPVARALAARGSGMACRVRPWVTILRRHKGGGCKRIRGRVLPPWCGRGKVLAPRKYEVGRSARTGSACRNHAGFHQQRRPGLAAALSSILLMFISSLIIGAFSSARAQFPQHRLLSIYPAGGRAGETVEVQVTGAQIEGPLKLWFDHPGIRAFHVKGPTFRVAIAPGAPGGPRDVRLLGPWGVSNPRTFVVGDRTETRETEPNDEPEKANPIAINTSVHGRMDSSPDVDCFAFEGKANQRVLAEVEGERIESRIDGVLTLVDSTGSVVGESHDGYGMDPLLDATLPRDGRYVIKLRDAVYNGSPEFVYRMTLHDGPHIDAAMPVVLPPGESREVTLIGRNLGGVPAPESSIPGYPLEKLIVKFSAPAEGVDPGALGLGYLTAPLAMRRGFEFRTERLGARSNTVFFAAATDPVVLEHEPNDDSAHAQEIAVPCDVSGGFAKPGDRDVFRFRCKKGQVWVVEATAERLGSLADPTFVIQQVPEKGEPRDLASADDTDDPAPGQPFSTATVDSSLRWEAPEDGAYQIVMSDLFGSQRGDVRLFYRLNVRPERPDYVLYVLPTNVVGGGGLTVRAGGRVSATIIARRIDGFAGPVEVEAVDLPDGVTSETAVIGLGQNQATLVLSAAVDAKWFEGVVRIVGRSRSGDRKEVLDYVPGRSRVRPEIDRAGLGANLVWDPQGQPPAAASRISRGVVLAVREGSPFLLTARPSKWVVGPGESIELTADVVRRPGFTDAVQVSAVGLPPNVGAAAVSIVKEKSSALLKLTIPANTPAGNYSFVLNGSGPFPFSLDPKATPKPTFNVVEPSNLISITVRR
jgi:hypothetical protein